MGKAHTQAPAQAVLAVLIHLANTIVEFLQANILVSQLCLRFNLPTARFFTAPQSKWTTHFRRYGCAPAILAYCNTIARFVSVAQPTHLPNQIQIAAVWRVVRIACTQADRFGLGIAHVFIRADHAVYSAVTILKVSIGMGIRQIDTRQIVTTFFVATNSKIVSDLNTGHFRFEVEALSALRLQMAAENASPCLTIGLVAACTAIIPCQHLVFTTAFMHGIHGCIPHLLVYLRHLHIGRYGGGIDVILPRVRVRVRVRIRIRYCIQRPSVHIFTGGGDIFQHQLRLPGIGRIGRTCEDGIAIRLADYLAGRIGLCSFHSHHIG